MAVIPSEAFVRAFVADEAPAVDEHDEPEGGVGVVYRRPCPTCKGNRVLRNGCIRELCHQCDGAGVVEELLTMERLAAMLREEAQREALRGEGEHGQ